MALRNQSPPPELMDEDLAYDLIDDTAFNKLGFIQLVKEISNKLEEYCITISDIDYDENLEFDDQLCRFMDMTVEPGVLNYLSDMPLIEPLCDAICINRSNRLNEIFIGILGNFASNEILCQQMSNNVDIVDLLVSFWSSPNSSFLLECARLLKMVLRNHDCSSKWLHSIKCNDEYLSHIIFIFQSSISSELLVSTMQVVGELMTQDEELCHKWICPELLSAALVARNEAEWFINNDVDYFHYILHLFSTHENGIVSLISNINVIYSGFSEYLNKICDEEPHLIMISHYHNGLRLVLPTIDVVVSNMTDKEALYVLQSESTVLDNLARLVYTCRLQSEDPIVQGIYLEISSFFNTIINITHSYMTSNTTSDHTDIKWLQSIDVGACLPQLQAFLACCTRNDGTKCKLVEITMKLSLTYLYEALTEDNIK